MFRRGPLAWAALLWLLGAGLAHAQSWVAFYEIRQDGNLIGAERVDFDYNDDGSYKVRTNGTLRQSDGGDPMTFTNLSELRGRPGGEFADYQREVYINQLPRKLAVEHDGAKFVVRLNVGKGTQDHKIAAPAGAVTTDVGIWGHLALLVRQVEAGNRFGKAVSTFNPSELSKGEAYVDDRGDDPVKLGDGYFQARRYFVDMGDWGASVWTDKQGRMLRLKVPSTGISVEIKNYKGERAAEATPLHARSAAVERIPVKIPVPVAEGAKETIPLNGVIRRPKGVVGPLPAVIFLSDGGPQDAEGVDPVTGIDTLTGALCDAIAEGGFAVVAWDDRGVGLSPGDVAATTLSERKADALAVLAWMSGRDDIDPSRRAVIGLGEGGNVAVRLAGGSAIKAAAAIAPSPVPLAKLAEEQARRRLNPDTPDFAAEFEDHPVMIALKKAKESKEEFTVIGGKPVYLDVFRQWQAHDPEADFKAAKTPVLYLVAGKDQQVFPELSKALVRSLGKREGYSQKTFEDVDHFLVKSRGTIGSYSDPDRRLDPEAVAYLVRWLATAF